jgi:hypothetical protein
MLAPVTHLLALTMIRRERSLRLPGKVLVRKGQKVNATDVVAEAVLTPEHLLVEVARGLGMRPEDADAVMQVKEGALLDEGDLIAGPVGLARRVVRAPRKGRVVLAGNGQALLEVESAPFGLKAGLPGDVVDLIPDRGAIIQTSGALLQGVWGNGRIESGVLLTAASAPEQVLTADRLDVSLRGSIVLAGHVEDGTVFKAAADLPLRGLILSSLAPQALAAAQAAPLAVMVMEGFGLRPMSAAAFRLLSTNERREAALNAEAWDPNAGTRPEVVIPLPAAADIPLPRDASLFEPGRTVRVVRPPHRGQAGTILSAGGQALFPSGVRAPAAEVRLESGETVQVPLANLEALE